MWLKLLSVFALGMVGLWEGIPAGFVLRLSPFTVGAVSALGSTTATLITAALGEQVQRRLVRRKPSETGERPERLIERVWRRYGIIGFGLLAPCLTGGPVGIALGMFLRAPLGRLVFWLVAGIALWSVILTTAGAYGSDGIRRLLVR